MRRVTVIALLGLIGVSFVAAGCMPGRLGPTADAKPAVLTPPAAVPQTAVRSVAATPYSSAGAPPAQANASTTQAAPSAARAFNDSRAGDVAMRSVRATECLATAITNRAVPAREVAENMREMIAWAAPLCQQELDALVTAYDRAYGAGLGLAYLRVYLRDLPDDLGARFKHTGRATS